MFVSDYYLTARLFNAGNSTRSSTHKMRYQYFFEDLLWSRTCSFGMGQFVWTLMSTSEHMSREMFCVHESEITAGVPSIPWLLPFKFWESWLSFWYLYTWVVMWYVMRCHLICAPESSQWYSFYVPNTWAHLIKLTNVLIVMTRIRTHTHTRYSTIAFVLASFYLLIHIEWNLSYMRVYVMLQLIAFATIYFFLHRMNDIVLALIVI